MTSKASNDHKHCLVGMKRPKAKLRARANKENARGPRAERQEKLAALLSAKE